MEVLGSISAATEYLQQQPCLSVELQVAAVNALPLTNLSSVSAPVVGFLQDDLCWVERV